MFLRAKEIPSEGLDKVEPWFGTKYGQEDIPNEWLVKTEELRDEFHLPDPNLFIAEDTSLCKVGQEIPKFPTKIKADPSGELFFKADATFKQPRAFIAYLLRSPLQLESLSGAVLLDLMVSCLLLNLTEDVYPADLAQLSYSVYAHDSGLVIRVSGLSDKLSNLLWVILDHLVNFESETTEKIFLAVQEQQRRNYHNHCIKAKKLVRDVRLLVLQDVYHAPHEKLNIVSNISLAQAS